MDFNTCTIYLVVSNNGSCKYFCVIKNITSSNPCLSLQPLCSHRSPAISRQYLLPTRLPAGGSENKESHSVFQQYYVNGPNYIPLASPSKVNTSHTHLFDLCCTFRPSQPSSFNTTSIFTVLGSESILVR